jgi:O-antigen ligase
VTGEAKPTLRGVQLPRNHLILFGLVETVLVLAILLLPHPYTLPLIGATVFLALGLFDARIALWVMIAFSTRVIYFHGAISAITMTTLGLLFVSVCFLLYLKFCLEGFRIKETKLNAPIAVFLGLVSIQTIRGFLLSHPIKWIATESFAYLGFGLIFFMIAFWDSKEMVKRFFGLMVVVAYYHSVVGLWNYFLVGHRIGGYLFGTFPSLVALVLLNLSFYARKRGDKLKYVLLSFPLIMHLLLSFTRGYWFGFLIALVFSYGAFIINTEHSFSKGALRFLKGATVSAASVVMLAILAQPFVSGSDLLSQLGRRFSSSFTGELSGETGSNVARLIEYKISWNRIKESPILGHGVGSTFNIINPVRHRRYEEWGIHQFYMMITLKMGLIGLFAFLWIYYVFFKEGLRGSRMIEDSCYKGLAYGFMANSVEQLVISFTNHQFATVDNNFYLAFTMAGVMVLISRETRRQTWTYQSS